LVIDRRLLARLGTIAIRFHDGTPEILSANPTAGHRPWAPPIRQAPHKRGAPASEALLSTAE